MAVPMPRARSLFFTVIQDFNSVGGDPSRANIHFMQVQSAVKNFTFFGGQQLVKQIIFKTLRWVFPAAIIAWLVSDAVRNDSFARLRDQPKHWDLLAGAALLCFLFRLDPQPGPSRALHRVSEDAAGQAPGPAADLR